jgi:16S rRNA (guanine527-N7)-methyltransferase
MSMPCELEKYFINVSRETMDKLNEFAKMMMLWNQSINLVSINDRRDLWLRHMLDCYDFANYLPAGSKKIVDIGSGAGFPGIIIAIYSNHAVAMIESDKRKVVFLREVIRCLEINNANVVNQRCEKIEKMNADIVTARAFAPLKSLFDMGARHLSNEGEMWLLKGKSIKDEIMVAKDWNFDYQFSDGYIVNIKNLFKKT